jgi:hypothetical protein
MKMKTKFDGHTPGPLEMDESEHRGHFDGYIFSKGSVKLARVMGSDKNADFMPNDEARANGRLWCAAPEMLDWIKEALVRFNEKHNDAMAMDAFISAGKKLLGVKE